AGADWSHVGKQRRDSQRSREGRPCHSLRHDTVRRYESRSHQVTPPHQSLANGAHMTNPGDALITMRNISKVFYTDEVETHALSDINLEITKGEYVAIAGPSGCGKSTLLSILG